MPLEEAVELLALLLALLPLLGILPRNHELVVSLPCPLPTLNYNLPLGTLIWQQRGSYHSFPVALPRKPELLVQQGACANLSCSLQLASHLRSQPGHNRRPLLTTMFRCSGSLQLGALIRQQRHD